MGMVASDYEVAGCRLQPEEMGLTGGSLTPPAPVPGWPSGLPGAMRPFFGSSVVPRASPPARGRQGL